MDKRSCYGRDREAGSNPSFSSTLLDAIYRSIDEGEEELVFYRETMRKKQQSSKIIGFKDEEEMVNFQRLRMIDKWMEKESEKVVVRRTSLADFTPKARDNPEVPYSNSSWSSTDSSSGGGFSSSEADDSVLGVSTTKKSSSSCYGLQRPKPIRTTSVVSVQKEKPNFYRDDYQQKQNHEGSFLKTKSRALKIYGDLKKANQPISPGGKLASFLNSLFNSGNAKKAKFDHHLISERKLKSANGSTCSSAYSFSRSCLSKTPSSRGKSSSNSAMKRSVRFYPVSVIVDEDCQPCGHKNLHDHNRPTSLKGVRDNSIRSSINEELKCRPMVKNSRVEEAAKDLMRNYQKRVELDYDLGSSNHVKNQVFDDDDDEDDAASCASSDLFELDNLPAIGMERFREELPVYETTHLDINRAIAKGILFPIDIWSKTTTRWNPDSEELDEGSE